ncbi:SCO family protein [Hydromonas duriensis]|uniref:Protein SCO1/2 n=1 Tax=Hydromonas duriensis TaxID=1527608 RepID=A0A4R6YAN2_9BURK|nr:SCO family protein [Hydromonas duriensis]TDR32576.1 protein SCO1/2 [Hydromonas duriensis]
MKWFSCLLSYFLNPIFRAHVWTALGFTALGLTACSPAPQFLNQNVSGAGLQTSVELTTAAGQPLQLNAALPNHVTALFFGFTQCPEVCPTTMGTMKLVKQALQKEGVDPNLLRVVFLSVDPERDTASILNAYTAAFDPSFIGVSTDLTRTKEVAKAYNVTFEKVGTGEFYTMNHTANLYLIDSTGRTRVSVPYGASADSIVHDVKQLLALNNIH